MATRIRDHFSDWPDPRRQAGRRHGLGDILAIAMCAVTCGADDWSEVAEFGRIRESFFRRFLKLPHGIPWHDTFGRVLAALEQAAFERCLVSWVNALAGGSNGKLIPIDGKTLRRSFNRADKKAAIHMVSAWAVDKELVFGQLATEAKSNEITAIPRLLELLDLDGATVTIDAEGCQKEIAAKIVAGGGDYVLALKGNQPTMYEEVKLLFDEFIAKGFGDMAYDFFEQTDGDHGRIEIRRAWCTSEVTWFQDRAQWAGLKSFAAVECKREANGKTSLERRYFISSLDGTNAQALARAVRSHWRIETSLHWSLDLSFAEDMSRV
jgi:predicted transposase YbfD/YdcC